MYALSLDERLPEPQRAAKRRRIEKLADDFLNGGPLFISSARPSPQSQQLTLAWHRKGLGEPKFVLHDVPEKTSAVWEDVEDDLEILQRCASQLKRRESSGVLALDSNDEHGSGEHETVQVEAQASCRPVRRLQTLKVMAGPM